MSLGQSETTANVPTLASVEAEHHMDRNCLKGHRGDRAHAALAAGDNLGLLIRGLAARLRVPIAAFLRAGFMPQTT